MDFCHLKTDVTFPSPHCAFDVLIYNQTTYMVIKLAIFTIFYIFLLAEKTRHPAKAEDKVGIMIVLL